MAAHFGLVLPQPAVIIGPLFGRTSFHFKIGRFNIHGFVYPVTNKMQIPLLISIGSWIGYTDDVVHTMARRCYHPHSNMTIRKVEASYIFHISSILMLYINGIGWCKLLHDQIYSTLLSTLLYMCFETTHTLPIIFVCSESTDALQLTSYKSKDSLMHRENGNSKCKVRSPIIASHQKWWTLPSQNYAINTSSLRYHDNTFEEELIFSLRLCIKKWGRSKIRMNLRQKLSSTKAKKKRLC